MGISQRGSISNIFDNDMRYFHAKFGASITMCMSWSKNQIKQLGSWAVKQLSSYSSWAVTFVIQITKITIFILLFVFIILHGSGLNVMFFMCIWVFSTLFCVLWCHYAYFVYFVNYQYPYNYIYIFFAYITLCPNVVP